MSDDATDAVDEDDGRQKPIKLISYPKIVFLYPTLIAAMLCSVYMGFANKDADAYIKGSVAKATEDGAEESGDAKTLGADEAVIVETHGSHVCARIFIMVLLVNLVVISFDFPRTTSLTLFFLVVAAFAIFWSVFRVNPNFLPFVGDIIASINPSANATFYFLVSIILIGLYIGVYIAARFDYWEVRPNELLHHHGFLSDLERFPAPNLKINKEINDVFEYLLLRSGRLILQPSNERRAVVLENVFFINRKESDITRMLSAVQVQVRND